MIIGGIIAISAIAVIIKKKKNSTMTLSQEPVIKPKETKKKFDIESIFKDNPELRDDDKELIKYIFEQGGQAYESDLRKKFLQPRTTMWRAVKRLERQNIVETEKKDLQNLVRLKSFFEVDNNE